ncbi:GNAT family N-acetyltransferase [Paenibacillus sp. HW567]|uniref:GNAT family N-acetyltransferase n=1 Tax=Paenibacillus sp. HW567 TaxID=1034769 RepID=UPI000369C2AF|nr:GNAT family N-acetyltransferase [Paenibacillus sp. HW567]
MFERFEADDRVLENERFVREEVPNNLIHMIVQFTDAVRLTSTERNLILAQSGGYNPWLWVSGGLDNQQQTTLVQELAEWVSDYDFPGISAQPETAKTFAEAFCGAKGKLYHTHMILEAYQCPEVRQPAQVKGERIQAKAKFIPVIAAFMAGFMEDAFGEKGQAEEFLKIAEEVVLSGNLYLWIVEGTPVSMAKITHRTARHGRINDVFTPRSHRKQGYASRLVAELCALLLAEGLTPVLYADGKNPDSNKVYQSIGFQHAGQIADIKFD